mmetsp:Transcript_17520/g.29180  ORF Transcript_17520/g.29180 Transcript_17520/m.29180 type:complete len:94 (+) Transcript_17520:780-1061(+)
MSLGKISDVLTKERQVFLTSSSRDGYASIEVSPFLSMYISIASSALSRRRVYCRNASYLAETWERPAIAAASPISLVFLLSWSLLVDFFPMTC